MELTWTIAIIIAIIGYFLINYLITGQAKFFEFSCAGGKYEYTNENDSLNSGNYIQKLLKLGGCKT